MRREPSKRGGVPIELYMPQHKFSLKSSSFEQIKDREWLVHNGIGGYASAHISGMNSRRYHGLLVASLNPPTERQVFVSRLEERAILADQELDLATNQYPGAIFPKGYTYLSSFKRNPVPEVLFEFAGHKLKKQVFMPYGSNTTIVRYENASKNGFELHVRLQLSYRNHHAIFREEEAYDFYRKQKDGYEVFYPAFKKEPLFYRQSSGSFIEDRHWNKDIQFHRDEMRGQEFEEDSYSPGYAVVNLAAGEEVFLTFSLEEIQMKAVPALLLKEEVKRQKKLVKAFPKQEFLQDLIKAGDQFLVDRASTKAKTILAGYHWFTDWGRDTMIAMRGLTIATGQQEVSRQIFETFFQYLDQGMLPNRFFDEGEEAEYNTVDATLWLFVALYDYVQKFEDWAYIESVMPQLHSIICAYSDGTRYHIHATKEGLLFAGDPNSQLTWMDARIWGHTVTPRWGCPVEINALWFNALSIFQLFSEKVGQESEACLDNLRKLKQSFLPAFQHAEGYLYDVVLPDGSKDDSIRPNQLYALSLPFPLVSKKLGKKILKKLREELFTPLGIRTLSPSHPDFRPIYSGGPWERDTAYHQGTVWPFLLGPYFEAYLWAESYSEKAKEKVAKDMEVIKQHFYEEGCIQGISEIFDGEHPISELGKGTAHQAWSVSVLIEVIIKYGIAF